MDGIARAHITGLVLAGGHSRRWGGVDKAWVQLNGRALVRHVCDRLAVQSAQVWVSANRDLERYATLGRPVLADDWPDGRGPLAGMATAARRLQTPWLLVAPVDTPGVPLDLAAQLADAALREDRQLASVHDGERLQPAFLLLHRDLSDALLKAVAGPIRRLGAWVQAQGPALVDARTQGWVSALRGANDATEFAALEAVMKNRQETGDGG